MTTKIEWTDETWNPIVGCSAVSEGCRNCYAARMTRRLEAMGNARYAGLTSDKHFNGVVRCLPERLDEPLKWKKPRRVFVNSMSDIFHPDVPPQFIDDILEVMAATPQHTYQVLTKRPELMEEKLYGVTRECGCRELGGGDYLPNVWWGTSVEDQQTANDRIPHLLRIEAAVRFLSLEPLLGPISLPEVCRRMAGRCWCGAHVSAPADGTTVERKPWPLHWVIVGGESGPGARPMHPNWVRSIRDQCKAAGVPFFFKQWGEWRPMADSDLDMKSSVPAATPTCLVKPDGHVLRPYCGLDAPGAQMIRVGKSRAGRLLDGVLHDEFPAVNR